MVFVREGLTDHRFSLDVVGGARQERIHRVDGTQHGSRQARVIRRQATDRTQVGFVFAKEPPKQLHVTGLAVQPRFVIPAGDANAEVKAAAEIKQDLIMTSLTPHMHVRGKDMTYIATYPDGRTETLLSVPKWDFNWQITYQLKEAKRMPKGTEIEVVAHYDNSPQNKFNPDPTKDVRWGDQTFEEMMIGFWGTVAERPKQ